MNDPSPIAHCIRCGRKLTNPVSIARHMGPVCAPRSKRVRKKRGHDGQMELFSEAT